MKIVPFIAAALLLTAAAPAEQAKTYKGVITDTMCSRDHKPMKISPDAKCVKDCVGDGKIYRYALLTAEGVYTLSDQETPAKFAAQQVEVAGVLYPKSGILKVNAIKPVK